MNGDVAPVDLESQEFREALIGRLNGQDEAMQRFIKLVDTRFQSHTRRLREHRQYHDRESLRIRQWLVGGFVAISVVIGTSEAIIALVERFV